MSIIMHLDVYSIVDMHVEIGYNKVMYLDLLKDRMKAYGMKALAEKAGVSRTSLYNFVQGENFEGQTLEKVLKVLGVEFGVLGRTPTYDEVCNHLAHFGAPFFKDESMRLTMSLEETAKWGIQFAKTDGLLDSVMPYFLHLNFKNLNRAKLMSLLSQEDQFQLLGYFLDLASRYSNNKKMKNFTDSFYRTDFSPLYFGAYLGAFRPENSSTKLSARALKVLNVKRNPSAQRWNVLTLGSLEDYFSRFRKWDKAV